MLYLFGPKETDFVNGDSDLIHNTYDEVVDRSKGFYLKFKVALDKDKSYKKIKKEMIINAYTPDGWNQFRVFDIYNHSNHVEVVATQLHYDLNYKKVFPFNLNRVTAQVALNVFVANFKSDLPNFKFTSNIDDLHSFSTDDDLERLDEGHNALEILNRIATRWGGELEVNGYNVHLISKLGKFTNALLYEHKNISEFADETSMSEVVTRIHAVSRFRPEREEGDTETPEEVVIKVVVDSPLIDEYAQVYEEDYTNNDARTREELISWANLKYSTNSVDKPARSIKVETNIIDGQEINYGDDLVLKYTKHDVDEIIRCVGYQYNPNSRQYNSVTLGSNMNSLSSTITGAVHDSTKNQLSNIEKRVQVIQYASNNRNRVTTGPLPIPNPIDGDMWYYHPEGRPNEVELRIFQNGGWETILSDMTGENVRRAIADLELVAEGLADDIASNGLVAEEAVAKAEDSLEQIGTLDTKISDLRTDLNTVGDKAESSLEIIGIDGGVMYSKNRRLGSKSQPIQPDDRGLIQHNGEGFELGETYTISMKVSCIYDDIITWEDRSRTESVPFVRETQYRTDLYPDESFVQRNGINGITTYTWQIELVNGEPTGNKTEEVISNHQAPVNEIFIQGTREEITWEERSRTESIPFVREIQYRTDLLPEESFVERNGVNGTATYTWQVELHKGEPTGNKTDEVRTNYQAPVNEIYWQGTKEESPIPEIVHFGDSIIMGYGRTVTVPSVIESNLNKKVLNGGFGGTMANLHPNAEFAKISFVNLADSISSGDWSLQLNMNLPELGTAQRKAYTDGAVALSETDFNTVEAIIVSYGVNDWMDGTLIDGTDKFDKETYLGALRYGLAKIRTAYPHLKVLVTQPIFWSDANTGTTSLTYRNSRGNLLSDFADALTNTLAVDINVPISKTHYELGMNENNIGDYFYSHDGTHPNDAGNQLLGNKIASDFNQLIDLDVPIPDPELSNVTFTFNDDIPNPMISNVTYNFE